MPAQLKEVRNRISSVNSTQQITKAMKLVAASKLRRAQESITKMRPYAAKLYEILGNITSGAELDYEITYAKERKAEKVAVVVLSSDRGLAGGFNSNVIRLARNLATSKYADQAAKGNLTVFFIGKKALQVMAKELTFKYDETYIDLFNHLSFSDSLPLAQHLMEGFENGTYDKVDVIYNRFQNQITQIPTVEQFLPIQKLEAEGFEDDDKAAVVDYIFEPSQTEILEELVPKILTTRFYRFLLDSNASEHGARMTAMDSATENAEELLRDLKILYNRARQAAITTELSEIVSGAAALQAG